MLKVKVIRASDLSEEVKEFQNYEELFNWMKKTYSRFIVEFTKDNNIEVTIYDDYVE